MPVKPTPNWNVWMGVGTHFVTSDSAGHLLRMGAEIGSMKVTNNFATTWSRADYGIQTGFIGGIATSTAGVGWRLFAATELGVMSLDTSQPWKASLKLSEGVFDVQARGNTVYAGTETSGVWKSSDGGGTWASAARGIVPTRVADLTFTAEPTPTLLAATNSGTYRSVDGGTRWSSVRLPEISFAYTVAADPVRPPIVWLGTGGGKVYRSIDSGKTFGLANAGLPDEDIIRLVHAPWTGVYALTATGKLYSTIDNGVSWFANASTCNAPATAVAVEPQRSWVVYAATAGGGVCKSLSGGLQWSAANSGIDNLYITSLRIDPVNPMRVWVGSVGKVYRSIDGGATWKVQNAALPATVVTVLTGDAVSTNTLYALSYGSGVYQSLDGGATWALQSAGTVATTAVTLSADPSRAGRLLAGTPNLGVQASLDGGRTWAAANDGMSLFVRSLAINPQTASTVYAGSFGGGLFRSRDAAATWAATPLVATNIFRVRAPSASRVLAGTSDGLAESVDSADSWAYLGQRAPYIYAVVTDPVDARRAVVAGLGGEVWLTDTTGARWRNANDGLPRADVLALTTCADGTVYSAVEALGVWTTPLATPGRWVNAGSGGLASTQVTGLACDPGSGFLYAASNGGGAWLSTDRGAHFTAINQGLVGNVVSAVLPSPINAWQVWAAVADGSVYRSDDAGLHWVAAGTGLPTGPNTGISHLVGAADGTLYAASRTGVYRRAVGVTTWALASNGLPSGVLSALWADPSRNGVLLAAVPGRGMYRSVNSGASWTALAAPANLPTVVGFAGGTARVYAASLGGGVAWSDNGGASFGPGQSAEAIPLLVADVALDALDPNTLYLAGGGQGFIVSRDGGAHWRQSNTGLDNSQTLSLAAHPMRAGEVYVGTHDGVYQSRDYGSTWVAIKQGLVNRNVTSLVFDTVFPDSLYVGIEGGGILFHDTRP